VRTVLSPEFKEAGSRVIRIPVVCDEERIPDFDGLTRNYQRIFDMIQKGLVKAAYAVGSGGVAEAISKMTFGNGIGFQFAQDVESELLFRPGYGDILLELSAAADPGAVFGETGYELLGQTIEEPVIIFADTRILLQEALNAWMEPLETVFPTRVEAKPELVKGFTYPTPGSSKSRFKVAKPRVFIPVFPGTNCEYDTQRAFEKAGAEVSTLVFRNLTPKDIEETIEQFVRQIDKAQIVMLPGGFSAGDEPDGSGKFIATAFRNPRIKDAVMRLLKERDGLMLGICNGFQALIKLGLVPYGEIVDLKPNSPTLTYNTLGRHVSCLVQTRIASKKSPWLSRVELGDIHTIAVSHGEGRFVADTALVEELARNGQIATQYVDINGEPSMDIRYNPNGSVAAIEGITSPDGRVFGKMGHSERYGPHLYRNVPGEKDQLIFRAGVEYFL